MPPKNPTLSEENTHLLIKSVKERPCIWNQDDKNYHDKFHTGQAWTEVCKILQMPENYIRAKWKNLRDLFKREIRRTRPTSLETYKGQWRHFQYLWFLYRPDENCPDVDIIETENSHDTGIPFVKYEMPDEVEAVYVNEDEEEEIPPKKIRKSEDFDVMFLKSLTPYFKELEPMRKLVVRNKMQDLLLNELAAQNTSYKNRNCDI